MPLPVLPKLPVFQTSQNFVEVPGGSSSGGSSFPGLGGINLGGLIPSIPGTGGTTVIPGVGGAASLSNVAGTLGTLFGLPLLRIAFFLMGLIAILGAIYLYKPTQEIVAAPIRSAKSAAVAAAAA